MAVVEQVFLTPTHLALVMEYAEGGNMLHCIQKQPNGRLTEDKSRWVFQQLIIGLDFCHRMVSWTVASVFCLHIFTDVPFEQSHNKECLLQGVANRDLKLENLLLDRPWQDGLRPLVKICDFGYSKSELSSPARTSVGKLLPKIVVLCNF